MRALTTVSVLTLVSAAATPAASAEWETGVSGFYHLGVAFSDGAGQDGPGILRDGEIHITGELTTDSGITYEAVVEIESFTSSDQIDKNYASVSGFFGTVKIGGDDTAIATYANGVFGAPGSHIGYVDHNPITTAADDVAAIAGGENAIGLHYDTPEFMGFQIGVSYLPSLGADGAGDVNTPVFEGSDFWSVGGAYNGEFGDIALGISAGYADEQGPNNDVWSVGGYVGFGGFAIAGGYQDGAAGYTDGAAAGETFYVGASYATGPWEFAGGYSNNNLNDTDVAAAWATYNLAPGVSMTGGLEYGDDGANEDIGGIAYMSLLF
ncbi:MAG: porin [Pseudomonadota bacterium]